MLWEIEIKSLMVWYAMVCYKIGTNPPHTQNSLNIWKWNDKKPKLTANVQYTNLFCKI